MSWLYIDNGSGYSKLLVSSESSSTTSYDNESEKKNNYYTSRITKYGSCFRNLSTSESKSRVGFYSAYHSYINNSVKYEYTVPLENTIAFNVPTNKEFWLRCDMYFTSMSSSSAFFIGNVAHSTSSWIYIPIGIAAYSNKIDFHNLQDKIRQHPRLVQRSIFSTRTLYTCLLHMKSNSSSGIMEFWVNGELICQYTGNVFDGNNFSRIGISSYSSGAEFYASCVVISDKKITFDYPKAVWSFAPENEISFDVIRNTTFGPEKNFDVVREIVKRIDVNMSTDVIRRIVTCSFSVDLEINLLDEVNLLPTNSEDIFQGQDTVSAVSVEKNIQKIDNPLGLQSLEINISEQQLTDQITFVASHKFTILQYVGGQYFDYRYELRIESLMKQGALYTYHCCSNIDKLLYTQCGYTTTETTTIEDDTKPQITDDTSDGDDDEVVDENDPIAVMEAEEKELIETGKYFTLKEYAENLSRSDVDRVLEPILRLGEYGNFYSSIGNQDLDGRTFADMIREIFGWTARIPHKLINIYIRADKIFFVQRGEEEHKIDITQTAHTQPTITQELVRTFWGATPYSTTEIEEEILGTRGLGGSNSDTPDSGDDPTHSGDSESGNKENAWLAAGSVTTSNSSGTTTTNYSYTANGVLTSATTTFVSNDEEQNFIEKITYSYNGNGLLESATTTITHPNAPEEDRQTVISYGYITLADGKTFLAHESTAEYEKNSEGAFELVDTTIITKSPTGRGQGGAVDSKGRGGAGGNIGDDRVTPYQIRSAFNTARANSIQTLKKTTATTINGFLGVDPSFPLLQFAARAEVTSALASLNRKIKETVSLNVYNFEHIIDFNDKIILNGIEYFLVSNTIKTTSRIYNEQSLTLVRWFDSTVKEHVEYED